jgi:hypothetical protein
MDLVNQFLELAKAHAWLPLISLALGFVVRLSKSDAIGPVVPSKYRPLLAWSLGAATFVVDALLGGAPVSAIIYGFGAPLLAILGHKLGIEKLRDGEEIPLPKLLQKKTGGGSGPGAAGTVALVLSVFLTGCTAQQVANTIDTAVEVAKDVEKIAKVLCLLDQAKQRGARADLVQDACSTVSQLSPYIPAARRMQANPRAFVVGP